MSILIVAVLLGGWTFGKIFSKVGLPSVLGMTIWGILLGVLYRQTLPPGIVEIIPFLKSLALIIILLRAGLGLKRKSLARAGKLSIKMAFIPCLLEGLALMAGFHFFLDFRWEIAGLTAFLLAAVSPAVVVPSMISLREEGRGKHHEVPTVILAGASVDVLFAITLFTIFLDLAKGGQVSFMKTLLFLPYTMILGILPGIILGLFLVWFFRKYHKKIRATEKALLLLGIGIVLLQIGEWAQVATLLGLMTLGFILLEKAEPIAAELSSKLSKAWVFAEIILFVFIGMGVNLQSGINAGLIGLAFIAGGLVFRSLGVLISTAGSPLTRKERLFCVIAYLPKATVQAAMGAVPLAAGIEGGEMILAFAVMAIIFTAPLGLIGIRTFSPRLLEVRLSEESARFTKR